MDFTQTGCDISGKDIVDYYMGRQSRHICQKDAASMECQNNMQLNRLAESLDSILTKQDECKSKTRLQPAPSRNGTFKA